MSEFSTVGHRVANVDALDKVTGGRAYPINVQLPGMLHGKMLRSPYAHARITRIDVSAALALPGVKAVITPDDVPERVYSPIFFMPTEALGCVQDLTVLSNYVRFCGQVVAGVCATTVDIAERALGLIEVDYEELPAVFNIDDAQAEGAPQLHERGPGNLAKRALFETGDVEQGFADADIVFEHTFETQRVNTCYLEPRVCVVDTDRGSNVTVWSSLQHLFGLREKLAYVLDIPVGKVRAVKSPYIGGGFGGKLDMGPMEPLATLMSFKTGRPVRIQQTRAEEFATSNRNPFRVELKTGVKKDGTLTVRTARSTLDAGAHATHGSTVIMVHGLFGFMYTYNCPNRRWEGRSIYTNNVISGGFRGYGAPQASFAVEQQMDAIAEALGIDAIELRLRNAHREGERHPIFDANFTTYRFEEALRRGAERIGWDQRGKAGSGTGVKKRGIGLGAVPTWTSNCTGQPDLYEHSGALIKLNPDGSADIASAAMDIGCGQNTTFCQIVAEELGIPFVQVRMAGSVDTSNVPFDAPMHASRGTHAAGGAIRVAAADLKVKMLKVAGTMLDAAPQELVARDGRIHVAGQPERSVSIAEVATRADSPLVQTTPNGPAPTSTPERGTLIGTSSLNPTVSPIPAGAMFVEVEVDTDSGVVTVERVVYAHDIGRVINPLGAEGQVEGGVQQGIGYALMEHTQFDPETGACLTQDFLDYKMPTACEMPKSIECIFIESNEPSGPFGAKSLSECCLITPAGAIANAVYNAIGVRIHSLPITPEKVLLALGKLS
jgi:xanthine dehydrogenase molybdenum-binding subunit